MVACPKCGRAFSRSSGVTEHIASVHSDERPHVCDKEGCGKAFKLRKQLIAHRAVHEYDDESEDDASTSGPNSADADAERPPAWLDALITRALAADDQRWELTPASRDVDEATSSVFSGKPIHELEAARDWLTAHRGENRGLLKLKTALAFALICAKFNVPADASDEGMLLSDIRDE
jgi:uncharacterized C2H2 Zn-finger protein